GLSGEPEETGQPSGAVTLPQGIAERCGEADGVTLEPDRLVDVAGEVPLDRLGFEERPPFGVREMCGKAQRTAIMVGRLAMCPRTWRRGARQPARIQAWLPRCRPPRHDTQAGPDALPARDPLASRPALAGGAPGAAARRCSTGSRPG